MGNEEHLAEPDNFHAHVSPQPIEAPQPRLRTLQHHRASIKAWQAAAYDGNPACLSYGTTCLIIETYLDSIEAQRREPGR